MLNKIKQRQSKSEGFTIIEVMIVLAIAGLILLIVFLAVPALQRNSRNTQRKSDVQSTLGASTTYSSNNNGAVPPTLAAVQAEIKPTFYTGATDIVFTASSNVAITTPDSGKMYVNTAAKCNAAADNFGGTNATSRNIAVVYAIETSGTPLWKCVES